MFRKTSEKPLAISHGPNWNIVLDMLVQTLSTCSNDANASYNAVYLALASKGLIQDPNQMHYSHDCKCVVIKPAGVCLDLRERKVTDITTWAIVVKGTKVVENPNGRGLNPAIVTELSRLFFNKATSREIGKIAYFSTARLCTKYGMIEVVDYFICEVGGYVYFMSGTHVHSRVRGEEKTLDSFKQVAYKNTSYLKSNLYTMYLEDAYTRYKLGQSDGYFIRGVKLLGKVQLTGTTCTNSACKSLYNCAKQWGIDFAAHNIIDFFRYAYN